MRRILSEAARAVSKPLPGEAYWGTAIFALMALYHYGVLR